MTTVAVGRTMEILLVEDNPGDVLLAREILREGQVPNRIAVARDGVEALDFLRRRGPHARAPRPDLILMDLNLPGKDGREVLAEIKADPALRRIPVVVLSTSNAQDDVAECYDLHANCYVTKPVGLDPLIEVLRAIESFWLKTARLADPPPRSAQGGGEHAGGTAPDG